MNPIFAGSAALLLTFILVSFGKRPKGLISSKSLYRNGLSNQSVQLTTLTKSYKEREINRFVTPAKEKDWQPPQTIQEKLCLNSQLLKAMQGGPDDRLEAIIIAGKWGHKSIFPILRRGLKDFDSRVMIAAAAGIERHRGANKPQISYGFSLRPPRNVSRIR